MDKYIGFDIDCKKTVVCVYQKNGCSKYDTIGPDVESMKKFLLSQKKNFSGKVHLVFEVSGQAGFLYDSLVDSVDSLTVANPSKMTWIFRTTKKNDRIDAYKMAKLLYMDEMPAVHMPSKEVRQWRETILHRKKRLLSLCRLKIVFGPLLKARDITSHCIKAAGGRKVICCGCVRFASGIWVSLIYGICT